MPHTLATGADSLYRRSMSRAGQDVASRVHVPIVGRPAVIARPSPYSKLCDTFRPRRRQGAARRTDLGCKSFVNFLERSAERNRFIAEHVTEGRPTRIKNGLRHVGLGESGRVHVSHGDVIKLPNDAGREFVQMVTASVGDASVTLCRLPSLSSTLSIGELLCHPGDVTGVCYRLTIGQHGQAFQAQVNANTGCDWPSRLLEHVNDDVQEPVATRILREVSSVPNLCSLRQWAGIKDAKHKLSNAIPAGVAMNVAPLDRNPAERTLAAPSQKRSPMLATRGGVLVANRVDRRGEKAKHLTGTGRQVGQIKAGRPFLVPLQSLTLNIVAVVPDEVHGPSHAVEFASEVLDAIPIGQDHMDKYTPEPDAPGTVETPK